MRVRAWVAGLGVLVAACSGGGSGDGDEAATTTTTTTSPDPWTPPEHRVAIDAGRFVERDSGEPFVARGVNFIRFAGGRDAFFSPASYDRAAVDAAFGDLASHGYNTVRIFVDSCSVGPGCMTREGEVGLDPDHLDVVADVLGLAADHDLVLLLTANDLPDGGGYRELAVRDDTDTVTGYRNGEFLTASGHEAMAAFWRDLMTGLVEREARLDVVLGWSILNEQWLFGEAPPLSHSGGAAVTATGTYDLADPDQRRAMVVDNVRALIATVAGEIRRHDPGALVTMGFFAPKFPHATGIGGTWYVDTAPLVDDSDLDFFDFHAYAGEDISIEQIAENFGVTDAKPTVMGEVGAFVDRYPSVEAGGVGVQDWIARSCAVGFDGWLYWAYDRLAADDATWGFTDEDGFLLEALSPPAWPDPCTPSLADPNLARGRPTTASRSLPDAPPERAVDGSPETGWGSGSDAPQWVEVDLAGPVTIGGLRLSVDQDPAGPTVHVVEVVTTDGSRREVHRFEGTTAFDDLLEVTFPTPIPDVEAVRITTLVSPSWVAWSEIEVLAG